MGLGLESRVLPTRADSGMEATQAPDTGILEFYEYLRT